jgi:hypothetical protein
LEAIRCAKEREACGWPPIKSQHNGFELEPRAETLSTKTTIDRRVQFFGGYGYMMSALSGAPTPLHESPRSAAAQAKS